MGKNKLKKFADMASYRHVFEADFADLMTEGVPHPHHMKGQWHSWFGNNNPIVVELGCGRGEYAVGLARAFPNVNYIGVDIKGARMHAGATQAVNEGLTNVAFIRTRIEFITAFFAENEISGIWLTFSDPQMRSENSRLTSPLFLERYRSFLKAGGVVHLKTDSRFLYEYSHAVAVQNGLEIIASTTDLYATLPGELTLESGQEGQLSEDELNALYEVQTFYEKLFLEQGYSITYLAFVIDHEGRFEHPEGFDEEYWRSVEGPRSIFGHDTAETRRQKLAAKEKQGNYAESKK